MWFLPFFQLAPLFYVELPSEEIQLERAVGSGSFSNVFFSLIDGIGVACKIPFKQDIPSFSEEVNLLKFLSFFFIQLSFFFFSLTLLFVYLFVFVFLLDLFAFLLFVLGYFLPPFPPIFFN